MKKTGLWMAAILLSLQVSAQEKVKVSSLKEESSIVYTMTHPLHTWTGECKEVNSVILTDASRSAVYQVAVSAKVASFDSKNANRDSHMMEVTEALKFPNVTYVSSSVTLDGEEFTSSGTLTFHGVGQPVAVKGKISKEGGKMTFSGTFNLKMSLFKIDPPSLMGVKTEDDFKLEFKIVYQ
ncbi:MAG: YceI family protein [Marinilabiliales bacterium]|nr:YceI family protein [Marinilabiliales bacterium]